MNNGEANHRPVAAHGFAEGPDAYAIERISKARKRFTCEGPLRAERPSDQTSPGSGGDALLVEQSAECTAFIKPGDVYAYLRPHFEDSDSYWTPHRVCLSCALKEGIIIPADTSSDQ